MSFVIQSIPEKCKACRRCEIACIAAHHGLTFKEALKRRDELVARVHVVKSGTVKTPISCRQCKDAPCLKVCPTGAVHVDLADQVVVSAELCSGCKLCVMACPYGAIDLEALGMPEDGMQTMAQRSRATPVRCDMCIDWRRREGKDVPACVEACPAHVRSMVQI